MIEHNNKKQDEETNFIGKTRFYDDTGNVVESLNQDREIFVINFPGSGMTFKNKYEDEVKESAIETCEETKKLLPKDEESLSQAFVCTAVYENKADKAIKEYNEENNNTHSNEIFEQILKPMIVDKDYNKTLDNLSRVIFRGHCFGCMVIAELENLLETKLKEQFNEVQCKNLLSAPQALISSPALQLDKYPKYFQTTAIVNNSDKTITGEDYCGDRLKQDLRELAGFDEKDLISLKAEKIMENGIPEEVPDIKISEKRQKNVHFIISNRAELPRTYEEMQKRIENRIKNKRKGDISYDKKKQVKKHIGGHEYFFLPDEPKSKFETSFRNALKKCQTRIKIRDIRKRLHNSNIDPLAQRQENMETITKENELQIGKTGNSSTGEISDIHKQTAKIQIECAKLAMKRRRLSQEKN